MRTRAFIFAGLITLCASAQLPQVQVPQVQVPGVQLPALPGAQDAVGGALRPLRGARALRANELLREHRAELDRDSQGDLVIREMRVSTIGTRTFTLRYRRQSPIM